MRTIRNINRGIVLIFIIASCNPKKQVDTEGLKEEMAAREIKRVTDAELMIRGEELGRRILDTTQKVFQKALMTALAEKGVEGAISYCNLNATTLVQNLQDSLGVTIRRVTDKPRNPADTLSDFEKAVFEAYLHTPELAGSQIQELDKKNLILNAPIKISNGACLNCHGEVGTQVLPKNYELIRSLYPSDQATGYKLNDMRGMWSVIIPKKTVIDQL